MRIRIRLGSTCIDLRDCSRDQSRRRRSPLLECESFLPPLCQSRRVLLSPQAAADLSFLLTSLASLLACDSVQTKIFKVLGQFVAKALMDSRIIDMSFSPVFLKLVLGQDVPLTLDSLRVSLPSVISASRPFSNHPLLLCSSGRRCSSRQIAREGRRVRRREGGNLDRSYSRGCSPFVFSPFERS